MSGFVIVDVHFAGDDGGEQTFVRVAGEGVVEHPLLAALQMEVFELDDFGMADDSRTRNGLVFLLEAWELTVESEQASELVVLAAALERQHLLRRRQEATEEEVEKPEVLVQSQLCHVWGRSDLLESCESSFYV